MSNDLIAPGTYGIQTPFWLSLPPPPPLPCNLSLQDITIAFAFELQQHGTCCGNINVCGHIIRKKNPRIHHRTQTSHHITSHNGTSHRIALFLFNLSSSTSFWASLYPPLVNLEDTTAVAGSHSCNNSQSVNNSSPLICRMDTLGNARNTVLLPSYATSSSRTATACNTTYCWDFYSLPVLVCRMDVQLCPHVLFAPRIACSSSRSCEQHLRVKLSPYLSHGD